MADLLLKNSLLVATMDATRSEIASGWVAITDGFISGVGKPGSEPQAQAVLDATDCLITPGLINTHHHLYQNLTRAYRPALEGGLFSWLTTLYPLWRNLNEESSYLSAWIGLLELAQSGCTTSSDHLYIHPQGGGDVLAAEIAAAKDLGFRFHPTRGSMSLSEKDGGLPPDSVVENPDRILEESERAVLRYHDPTPGSMLQIALAPCSPFSVTSQVMEDTAHLAERLDVRLHTHLAETLDEADYCRQTHNMTPVELFQSVGWGGNRTWIAHCVHPSAKEIQQLGSWGTGVAHCPSSNMILASGLAPVRELRQAGVPVGLGCDGSASADSGSLWTEARMAYLQGRLRDGMAAGHANTASHANTMGGDDIAGQAAPKLTSAQPKLTSTQPTLTSARDVLEMATLGGASCLGRLGELGEISVGAVGDVVAWKLDGAAFAGALSDPVEAWLRCGPLQAHHTVIAGRPLVRAKEPQVNGLEEKLRQHRAAALRMQAES